MKSQTRNRTAEHDFDSTFATFFSEHGEPCKACTDCVSESNLEVLHTLEEGGTVWVCSACKAKRQAAQKESERREANRIDAWATMDEWEE